MATDQTNTGISNAVRIKGDKMKRAARVARKVAAIEDKKVSAAAVVDEILEEGLTSREQKLGI